jgi:hypothetical protein
MHALDPRRRKTFHFLLLVPACSWWPRIAVSVRRRKFGTDPSSRLLETLHVNISTSFFNSIVAENVRP